MAVFDLTTGLALVAAIGFGLQTIIVDIGMKRARGSMAEAPVLAATIISVVVSAALFWGIIAVQGLPSAVLSVNALAPFAIAGVAYPGAFRMLYFGGINRVGPSIAGALAASNPVIAALTAMLFLGERMTVLAGMGIICIVAGGALIQVARNAAQEATDIEDIISVQLADASPIDLLYPIAAAVMIGCALTAYKYGLNQFPHPVTATATAQTAALVVFLGLTTASGERRGQLVQTVNNRSAVVTFVLAGVIVAGAWLSQFFALERGTVVLVVPLLSTYPIVIIALSYGMERKIPRSPLVIVGILAIVAGASLVKLF